MTETVRIMPRQPIEAKRDEFGEGYYTERGASIVHRDYLNSGGVGWVEVSDPIVWDGSLKTLARVEDVLPLDVAPDLALREYLLDELDRYDEKWHEPLELRRYPRVPGADYVRLFGPYEVVGVLVLGARIRAEGDSFVILPPEGCQS